MASGKHIVVAADTSDESHEALKWVMSNLYSSGDTCHLVHCFTPLQPAVGPHYAYVPTETEQEKWRLEQAKGLETCVELGRTMKADAEFKAHLIAGDPRDELIAAAKELKASALVVGSRGRGAIKRALLGSTSSYLAHHSTTPVVIVHAGSDSS